MIGLRWRETPSRGTIVGMNSTLDAVRRLLLRDLDTLRDEIRAYPQEEQIWAAPDGIRNTAGTLALHLAGNLHHYLGTVLGGGDYVRDRPAEFGDRGRSRDELLDRIAAAREAVDRTLSELDPARLAEPFPVKVGGVVPMTGTFLMHLAVHCGYHLGQLDYHRRVVTGDPEGVGAQSVAALVD
jgi:uncharacterized damage-inducible protein DinB